MENSWGGGGGKVVLVSSEIFFVGKVGLII